MQGRRRNLAGVFAVTLALAVAVPARGAQEIGDWGHGSWCWFADPRAVRIAAPQDKSFVSWLDWAGRVTIGAYDATTGQQTTTVVGSLYHDDHGSPTILVEPDKRLTVFWSAHNGSALYFLTSLLPESIAGWGPVHTVPVRVPGGLGFTYPNPVLLSGEEDRLYLFWRGATWAADHTTRTGGRWGRASALIENRGQRPYVKVDSNGRDTIAFAFTEGNPRDALTSIYYMAYRRGWLRHANGRRFAAMNGKPITPRAADGVYDARGTRISAWVWDVAVARDGRPVIVYATFPSRTHHLYWYARWNGRGWTSHLLTDGGPTISPGTIEYDYSGGLALDHRDPSVVYLSRKTRGWFEIERWQTSDRGAHWRHTT